MERQQEHERREEGKGGEGQGEGRGEGGRGERKRAGEMAQCQSMRELMGWCTNICLLFGRMFGIAMRRKSIFFVCRARR